MVTVGSGNSMQGEGLRQGINLHLQGINITDDFLPLGLITVDAILGIQWFEALEMTHMKWKTQLMKFNLGKEIITRRDPS